MKQPKEWKKIRGKCAVCASCWIIDEGPAKGMCIYGGPYSGYQNIIEVKNASIHVAIPRQESQEED